MVPILWVGLVLLGVAGAADVISAVFRQNVQYGPCPTTSRGGCRAPSSPWWPAGPAWATSRPASPPPSGDPEFAVWSGGLACVVGVGVLLWRVPELWADDGGGRPFSAAEREEAVAEAITELNEGEPL